MLSSWQKTDWLLKGNIMEKKWRKSYQVVTQYRLSGERDGHHLRIISGFKPKNLKYSQDFLTRVEKELLRDCSGTRIITGPMIVLEV